MYNIYLNSPQLAVQANRAKYYKYVIQQNKKIQNSKFKNYTPVYYQTSYNSIFYPNISSIPL